MIPHEASSWHLPTCRAPKASLHSHQHRHPIKDSINFGRNEAIRGEWPPALCDGCSDCAPRRSTSLATMGSYLLPPFTTALPDHGVDGRDRAVARRNDGQPRRVIASSRTSFDLALLCFALAHTACSPFSLSGQSWAPAQGCSSSLISLPPAFIRPSSSTAQLPSSTATSPSSRLSC